MIVVEVRVCDADDLKQLRSSWPTPADVAGSHYAEQRAGHASFLVVWSDGEPVGWAVIQWGDCLGSNAKAAYPGSAEVIHLQVRPELRNRGAGTALLQAAEKAIADRNIAHGAVSVSLENPDAARLFDRCGYHRTGIIDVSEYDWVENAGSTHHKREVNELLIKRL